MKIAYNWLKVYLPELELTPDETAVILTDTGLEVEAVEDLQKVKGGLEGLVVGYVLEKEKHPDADRLNITQVQVDEQGTTYQVVCGAANVDKGQKVIVALPGTTVYPVNGEPFKIKRSKIRGVESNGMICAEDEVGLGTSHEGIMVLPENTPIGKPLNQVFDVSGEKVIHIGLTPNRIDAASHLGVARDLRAALAHRNRSSIKVLPPEITTIKTAPQAGSLSVEIQHPEGCKQYYALEISGVKVQDSPDWLKNRLESIGIRSINNIVDITNFVMHECGQPLHAFDADKISGKKVLVRTAGKDELFVTLDGVERKLSENDLVIADAEKPMCLAGIFGGLHSGVTSETRNILLESAWFNPVMVRKSARRYELNTDSSFRFERGADPEMTHWALCRAADLIKNIAGGTPAPEAILQTAGTFTKAEIVLDLDRFNAFTGKNISETSVEKILQSLDFTIIAKNGKDWKLQAPLYRVDVTRPADVYEEILRIYGYNNIPIPAKTNATAQLVSGLDREHLMESLAEFLVGKGLNEIMTNSLTAAQHNNLAYPNDAGQGSQVQLLNPLSSELNVLRNSMLYGGLQSVAYNLNRQQSALRFFECGSVYSRQGDKFVENQQVAIWITGAKGQGSWNDAKGDVDYYTLKGLLEALVNRYTKTNTTLVTALEHPLLNDTFAWALDKKTMVEAGSVKPEVLKKFDVQQPVFYACVYFDVLAEAIKRTRFRYKEVSKFPFIRRDLSLLLDEKVEFAALQQLVLQTDKQLIKKVEVFDVYKGKNLEPGKKSYAISLTISDDNKTLKDEEVEKLMEKVLRNITEKTGATLR